MPFADLGEKRIWYEINGEGEPLVQIPGGALGLKNFSKVTPVLSRHFRVIDFDLVGTGKSTPTPPGYKVQDWTNDLAALMDHLAIPQAHLHGTSTGGLVALQFAVQHPERVGDGPVLSPDRPWEGIAVQMWGSALYDGDEDLFKMWYSAGSGTYTNLAYSDDGLQWYRPEFDIVPHTNVILKHTTGSYRDSFSPWLDLSDCSDDEKLSLIHI